MNATATPDIYTLSLHDALPIFFLQAAYTGENVADYARPFDTVYVSLYKYRSEEHTSELQSLTNLVCRLLLEKKNADGGNFGPALHESCSSNTALETAIACVVQR